MRLIKCEAGSAAQVLIPSSALSSQCVESKDLPLNPSLGSSTPNWRPRPFPEGSTGWDLRALVFRPDSPGFKSQLGHQGLVTLPFDH